MMLQKLYLTNIQAKLVHAKIQHRRKHRGNTDHKTQTQHKVHKQHKITNNTRYTRSNPTQANKMQKDVDKEVLAHKEVAKRS